MTHTDPIGTVTVRNRPRGPPIIEGSIPGPRGRLTVVERVRRDSPTPGNSPAPPALDGPETIRRAMRAVTRARLLVANSEAGRARRLDERGAPKDAKPLGRNADGAERASYGPAADASVAVLREAVESYVSVVRDAGATPEKMLVALKTVLKECPIPALDTDHTPLEEAVVTWSIRAYFKSA